MPDDDWYELIDAGDGRRLERFGERVVDRPAPSVEGLPRGLPAEWAAADGRYDRTAGGAGTGVWHVREPAAPDTWPASIPPLAIELELRLADGGQVGVFPEHVELARWAVDHVAKTSPPSVLNLFAYTGAATLALAAAGASVTHVDASRTAIEWARRNAAASGLTDRPIRWLVDDSERFVAREHRRGRRYDALILDPPSFGRGPSGRGWRLEDRLGQLLHACARILAPEPVLLLVTSHTPAVDEPLLRDSVRAAFDLEPNAGDLTLTATSGNRLPLGSFVRWARTS